MPLRSIKSVHFADSDDIVPSPLPSPKARMPPTQLPPVLGLGLELGPARGSVEARPRRDTVPLPGDDWAEGGAVDGQSDSPRSSTSAGSDDPYPNALGFYASANEYPNTHQGHAAYTSGGDAYPPADAAHSRSLGVSSDDSWSSSSASSHAPSPLPLPPTCPLNPNLRNFPREWDLRSEKGMPKDRTFGQAAFFNQDTKCILAFHPPLSFPNGRLDASYNVKKTVEGSVKKGVRDPLWMTDILEVIEDTLRKSRNASFVEHTNLHYEAAVAARASRKVESTNDWRFTDLWPAAPHLFFWGLEPAGHEKDRTMIYVVKLGTAPPPNANAL